MTREENLAHRNVNTYSFSQPVNSTSQISMATSLPWRTSLASKSQPLHLHHTRTRLLSTRHSTRLRAFRRNDFDDFSSRFSSGKLWTDLWKSANDGFEQFAYETRKTAEKIDRRFAVSRRLSDAAESAKYRAKEIDRDLRIMDKWRSFSFDFSRNWPSVSVFIGSIIL